MQPLRSLSRRKLPQSKYAPRYWVSWIVVGCAWLVARAPLGTIRWLGIVTGRAMFHLAPRRRRIAATNLRLCFPELDADEHDRRVRQTLIHSMVGVLESAMIWLNPDRDLSERFEITGLEHVRSPQAAGRGVLLVCGHFTMLDVIAELAHRIELDVVYRRNNNPVWEWLQVTGRARYFHRVTERNDVRPMLEHLHGGGTLLYLPDQDFGVKGSVFVPFFGIPAATITATARLAERTGAAVVFLRQRRDLEYGRWYIDLEPVEGFPTGNAEVDARRINALLEDAVRASPEQYLWIHRRFKTRPPGEQYPY